MHSKWTTNPAQIFVMADLAAMRLKSSPVFVPCISIFGFLEATEAREVVGWLAHTWWTC